MEKLLVLLTICHWPGRMVSAACDGVAATNAAIKYKGFMQVVLSKV
jgi:hypothetical protein